MVKAKEGIDCNIGVPRGTTHKASGEDQAFSSLPSPSCPGPSGQTLPAGNLTKAPPKEAADVNLRSQRSLEENRKMSKSVNSDPRLHRVGEGNNKLQKISNSKCSIPVGRAFYKLYLANLKTAKKIRKEIDRLIPEKEGSMEIGLLNQDGKSIIRGDEERHKPLVTLAEILIARASPEINDFKFTALAITKGWPRLKTITDADITAETLPGHTEPLGEKIFFPWSEKAYVFTKMDASSKVNIHGKLLRWDGKAKIKIDAGEGDAYGLYLYNVRRPSKDEAWEEEALSEMGFPDRSSDDVIPTTSEESGAEDTVDPTINLDPIIMTKKWESPPPRGAGWWGQGPPLQVHHNYRTRDLVDGGGALLPRAVASKDAQASRTR